MKSIDYLKDEYHLTRHWMLDDRSRKILEFFKKYATKEDRILELGCSSGRNLVFLKANGYDNLTGLEMYPVSERNEFKLIRGRYEETELEDYDIIFSASFLQEFETFPQVQFNQTLKHCKKYFMIFGDYLRTWQHPGFVEIERIPPQEPFSQPIIILKNEQYK